MTIRWRKFSTISRHLMAALTAVTLVAGGSFGLPAAASDASVPPHPLTTAHLGVLDAPGQFYLTPLQSDGTHEHVLEPAPVLIHEVPYIPYRVHEFSDAIAIELPSAQGRQAVVFDRSALGASLFSQGDDGGYYKVATQRVHFDEQSVPDIPAPGESSTPSPEASASAWGTLRDVFASTARADDIQLVDWNEVTVASVSTALDMGRDAVTITQQFAFTSGGTMGTGRLTARYGFDGSQSISTWSYTLDADGNPHTYRARLVTDLQGTSVSTVSGTRQAYAVEFNRDAGTVLTLDDTEPIASASPTELVSPSIPPTTDASGSVSLFNRIEDFLAPAAHAEDIASGSATETPAPVESEQSLPSEIALPSSDVSPEPSISPEASSSPEPVVTPVEEGTASASDEPLPPAPIIEPVVPIGVINAMFHSATDWIRDHLLGSQTINDTVVMDSDGAHTQPVYTEDSQQVVATYTSDPNSPPDTAFFVNASFGMQTADTGVTVTSGDGTTATDFRIHFNPALGGAIDELYTGADFTTDKVATPASSSGSLDLTNIGSYHQTDVPAVLTVLESSPVRTVVQAETAYIASGSAPASLVVRYAIYPSGRVIKTSQINVHQAATVSSFVNASAGAYDAGFTDTDQHGQLYLASSGPGLLAYWQDPAVVASASVTSQTVGGSLVTRYDIPVVEGQTTWYQLFELTSSALQPLVPESYQQYPDDYRTPDAPVMTRGSFLGFSSAVAAYQFEAVNNVAVFRLNGSPIPRINPAFEITKWTDPDLSAFKAQLNGRNLQEGVDYVIGLKNNDLQSGTLLFQYLHTVQAGDQFSAQGDPNAPPLFDLDPSNAAAIKRVQRNTIQQDTNTIHTVVTLPFAVTTSRSFVLGGDKWGGSIGTPSDPEKSRLTYWLSSPTQLVIDRTNIGSTASTSWRVMEFEDNSGALVQRGSVSFAVGDTTQTVTLPTVVNTNKAFAVVTQRGGTTDQTADEEWTVRASLSASTLELSRLESGIALQVTWQVVQLDGINVQRGLTTFSGATGANVTISSVATNKSFIISSARAAAAVNGVDSEYQYNQQLTSPTTLHFSKSTATSGVDIAWFVVTFTDTSGSRVRSGTQSYAATLGYQTSDGTISPAVIATRSMGLVSSAGAPGGDTADLDALTFGVQSINSTGTLIRIGRDHGGTARTASASWSVVEFTRPSIQQNRYRWRNDDGNEVTATWAAPENASISMTPGNIYRLRFGLNNADSGSATDQFRIEFTRKAPAGSCSTGLASGWSWQAVPVSPSTASDSFNIIDSPNITDAAATTNVAGGLTDGGSVFVPGETKDTGNQTSSIGLASTSFTEIEYSLTANQYAASGGKYCFRVTDAGDARASHSFIFYPTYAQAQVNASPTTLTQDTYRWYVNRNGLPPTDPWTQGAAGNFGTGADGAVTLGATGNINTNVLGSLRSTNADGIATYVTASPSSTTLKVASTTGIATGDEIAMVDMEAASSSFGSVGNYEFFTIAAVPNSTTLTLTTSPKYSYVGASSSMATTTQTYAAAGTSTFSVPAGYTTATAKVWAAGGGGGEGQGAAAGGAGGGGGFAQGTFTVTPGETLNIDVGTGGVANTGVQQAGNGGGFSAVRRSSTYLVQAGGGGGGGSGDDAGELGGAGGAGGGTTGVTGQKGGAANNVSVGGGGGTQSSGGAGGAGGVGGVAPAGADGTAGAANAGGNGGAAGTGGAGGTGGGGSGAAYTGGAGGGGGGGMYGGGGGENGADATANGGGAGGGGGSSGFDASVTSTTNTAGSGTAAGNNGDSDYAGSAGLGGTGSAAANGATAGNPGRVVITATKSGIVLHHVIVQRVPQWTNVTINNGGSLTANTWSFTAGGMLFFRATGTVTVNTGGSITMAGKGFTGGAGTTTVNAPIFAQKGGSYNNRGRIVIEYPNLSMLGGGGAGSNDTTGPNWSGSSGGGGGYATTGGVGATSPNGQGGGFGGDIYGNKNLTKIFMGSGGGGGGSNDNGTNLGANGGAGGGIIYFAANSVSLPGTGTISANGAAGSASSSNLAGSGGGGSGGSIFITGASLAVGTGLITAAGGAGGVGPSPSTGGTGGSGRILLASDTITGTTTPTAWTQGGMTFGGSDLDENVPAQAQFVPPDVGGTIRLRMNVRVSASDLAANSQAFTLQFAELPNGTFECANAASWNSVVASTSSAAAWAFASNDAVQNGVQLDNLLLSTSSVSGTYAEANPTALNPLAASVGQGIEYDFPLKNVSANPGSKYCFRMATPSGMALSAYNRYPYIVTQPSPNSLDYQMRHGTFFDTQGEEQPEYWTEIH